MQRPRQSHWGECTEEVGTVELLRQFYTVLVGLWATCQAGWLAGSSFYCPNFVAAAAAAAIRICWSLSCTMCTSPLLYFWPLSYTLPKLSHAAIICTCWSLNWSTYDFTVVLGSLVPGESTSICAFQNASTRLVSFKYKTCTTTTSTCVQVQIPQEITYLNQPIGLDGNWMKCTFLINCKIAKTFLINCKIIATHCERTTICIPCRSQWNLHRSQWNMHLRWLEYASEVIGCQSDGIYGTCISGDWLNVATKLWLHQHCSIPIAFMRNICNVAICIPLKNLHTPFFLIICCPNKWNMVIDGKLRPNFDLPPPNVLFLAQSAAFASLQNFLACF